MRKALCRLFIPYEAEQLEALFLETWNKIPQPLPPEFAERMPPAEMTLEQVRDRAKAIIGKDGWKLLMAEASLPKDIQPNSLEGMEFNFTNPLVWWARLQ